MGIDTDETKEYFLADKYRLQRYLSNATVVAIDDTAVGSRTSSENTMWTYACNEHLLHKRKRLK